MWKISAPSRVGVFLEWDKEGPLRHCLEIISVTFYKLGGFLPQSGWTMNIKKLWMRPYSLGII